MENCLALCPTCHYWFDGHITSGRIWLLATFPEKVAYLETMVEETGIPRSARLFTDSLEEQIIHLARMKEELRVLKDGDKRT
jgi:hypothetical protein